MRRFLYYNQDSINSLLAQIEQGLLLKQETGEEQTDSASSTIEAHANVTGDLSAKVFSIGASLQGSLNEVDSDTDISTKMVKSVQEKALHDYAFDKVHEYIQKHNLVIDDNPIIGDVVLLNEIPTILDFNYFQGLFADNGALRLANDQAKKELDSKIAELKQSIPKGTQMPEVIKAQIKLMESKIKAAEPERKEIAKTMDAIRNTLPYNRFLMPNCMLAPLEDKNFRDDPNIVAF